MNRYGTINISFHDRVVSTNVESVCDRDRHSVKIRIELTVLDWLDLECEGKGIIKS